MTFPTTNTLNAEEITFGSGPRPDTAQMQALPELMERLHFREIERCTLGLVQVVREGELLRCSLFGKLPVLVFRHDGDTISDDLAERRWRIVGGVSMRRDIACTPIFTLGIRFRHAIANRSNWTAWVRVEDFPSVFLGLWKGSRLRLLGQLTGSFYRLVHRTVSRKYLDRLSERINSGAVR